MADNMVQEEEVVVAAPEVDTTEAKETTIPDAATEPAAAGPAAGMATTETATTGVETEDTTTGVEADKTEDDPAATTAVETEAITETTTGVETATTATTATTGIETEPTPSATEMEPATDITNRSPSPSASHPDTHENTDDATQTLLETEAPTMSLEDCMLVIGREQASKLMLANDLAETQEMVERLTKKVVVLQVEGQDQRLEIETLREKLMISERSERERFEEVKLQAQRLREVELQLEESQRSMANIRAPPPVLPAKVGAAEQTPPRFGFGKILKTIQSQIQQPQPTAPPAASRLTPEVEQILQIPGNAACADCNSHTTLPTWVCVGQAVLLCTGCASVHRSLGTHISKIKSLTLDNWSPSELQRLKKLGNTKANRRLLAKAPPGFAPPIDPDEFRMFISQKYGDKIWEGVPDAVDSFDDDNDSPSEASTSGPEGGSWITNAFGKLTDFVAGQPADDEIVHDMLEADESRVFLPSIQAWQRAPAVEGEAPKLDLMPLSEEASAIGPLQRTSIAALLPPTYRERDWVCFFENLEKSRVATEHIHATPTLRPTYFLFLCKPRNGDCRTAWLRSTPRYSRLGTKGTLFTRGILYFKTFKEKGAP